MVHGAPRCMEVQEGVHAVFMRFLTSGTRYSFNPPMTRRYLVTEIQPNTTALRLSPVHTLYLAKGPAGPGARGGAPEENFWPIQRIFRQKTHTQTTYSTSFESPRRALCTNVGTRVCEL